MTDLLPKATAVIEDAIVVEKLPAAPEFGQFKVTVPGDDFQSLGLEVDKTSVRLPMITEVKDGAVQKFNEMNPQTKIQVHDGLVAVDGAIGADAIIRKLQGKPAEKMVLTIHRPKKIEVSLMKTGGLGLKLDYKAISKGAVVVGIVETGLLAKWNTENPNKVVQNGDRIVAFNGKECLGDELLSALKKAEGEMVLTVLKNGEK